jgi:GGDEF domain-containing protein
MLDKKYYPQIDKGWVYNVHMIDVNNLHKYNREKGYLEGDKLLKKVINDIKDEMKNQNINREIYRTGEMNF